MGRPTRLFLDNLCYHISTRGNQKQNVFREGGDFCKYLKILKKAKKKYKVLLYAYCLMPNHIHLLIAPKQAQYTSKFMHWLNRGYTAYFNTKYQKVGHLWQGRFKNKLIIKDRYLLHCATYIEENPVRANIVKNIAEYQWSSYRERCLFITKSILNEIILG